MGIAWNWEPDNEFVEGLHNEALGRGLKPYLLHAYNFYSSLKDIAESNIYFRFFLNRTNENDSAFNGLSNFLMRKNIAVINRPDIARRSEDKFLMHAEFKKNNIPVPETFFLMPGDDNCVLEAKIKNLSKPFVLKPAAGSCGDGVVLGAKSVEDILQLRRTHGDIPYLAQERIFPEDLKNKPAWFRVFCCHGKITPCWWHPETHAYRVLERNEMDRFELSRLFRIAEQIISVCKLDFFTTEIAVDGKGDFFVIDYANDQPDMRKQSKFKDGVPDRIVDGVIADIVSFVKMAENNQ